MERRAAAIHAGATPELVWLLEHPPLYTAGTSARIEDLVGPPSFPVHRTGRGGQFTYHGPGQRVAYVLLDLRRRTLDIRSFVCRLEAWLIGTLGDFGILGERRAGRVGVWVDMAPYGLPGVERKIAAIGVRIRRWVSYHGVAINVAPNLKHYDGIVPCGIREHGVTSLQALGRPVALEAVDDALHHHWSTWFGANGLCAHGDRPS